LRPVAVNDHVNVNVNVTWGTPMARHGLVPGAGSPAEGASPRRRFRRISRTRSRPKSCSAANSLYARQRSSRLATLPPGRDLAPRVPGAGAPLRADRDRLDRQWTARDSAHRCSRRVRSRTLPIALALVPPGCVTCQLRQVDARIRRRHRRRLSGFHPGGSRAHRAG